MVEIRKILVTTDFSDTSMMAFDHARLMAERFRAKVILAYIEEEGVPPFTIEYAGAQVQDIIAAHRKHATASLDGLARERFAQDVEVETRVGQGIPHREIVRLAEQGQVDLIVMATHGRGFISHALFGSTTERVVRHAPCPVLTVPGRVG